MAGIATLSLTIIMPINPCSPRQVKELLMKEGILAENTRSNEQDMRGGMSSFGIQWDPGLSWDQGEGCLIQTGGIP